MTRITSIQKTLKLDNEEHLSLSKVHYPQISNLISFHPFLYKIVNPQDQLDNEEHEYLFFNREADQSNIA